MFGFQWIRHGSWARWRLPFGNVERFACAWIGRIRTGQKDSARILDSTKPLAVVTGASTGIGREPAKQCGENSFDLVLVADEPKIREPRMSRPRQAVEVDAVEADRATSEGVDKLMQNIEGARSMPSSPNAGRGLGEAFLDENLKDILFVIDTNVIGTIELIHRIGRGMRARGKGKILITGSVRAPSPPPIARSTMPAISFLDSPLPTLCAPN